MQTPNNQQQDFSIVSILERSFKILMKNPLVFLGLTLIAIIPSFLITLLWSTSIGASYFASVLQTILILMAGGGIVYGVYQILRGQPTSIGETLTHGLARLLPLFLVALLAGLGIGIGLLLLVVPGVILGCIWAVCVPACVIEKLNPIESLKRSMELTSGYRVTIFILILIVSLASFLILLLLGLLFFFSPFLVAIFGACVAIILNAYQYVMLSIVYFDLRKMKEGVTLDRITFD